MENAMICDVGRLTRPNDWTMKPFFALVFGVQLLLLGLVALDGIGITVPIIRPLVGIAYLLFIPGLLVLRVLRIHNLSGSETLLYALGVSITLVMLLGVLINAVYSSVHALATVAVEGPLTTPTILTAMAVLVITLSIGAFARDRFFTASVTRSHEYVAPPLIYLLTLPFLGVLGAYVMTFYGLDTLIIALVFLIAAFVLLSAFTSRIPHHLYPAAVFTIALAVLFSRSVLSLHVWGWDINLELFVARSVYTSSLWNTNLAWDVNAMPSVTILAPIAAKITGLDLVWVFKLVYPLIFAFVPLGVYKVIKSQATPPIAFFSAFFFISILEFFEAMPQLARQEVAELYLVLILLLLVDRKLQHVVRSLLLITFALSLVISHYGLTYIAIGLLIGAWIILSLRERPTFARLLRARSGVASTTTDYKRKIRKSPERRIIDATFIILFLSLALTWYGSVASGSPLTHGLQSGEQILTNLASSFDPKATQALYVLGAPTTSLLHSVTKDLVIVSLGFFAIGLFAVLAALVHVRLVREYLALSIASFLMLACCIAVPFFANQLNTYRMYQIATLFSGVFIVLGMLTIVRYGNTLFRRRSRPISDADAIKVVAVFAVVFLLFNTGTIYSLAGDVPAPIFGGMLNTESYPIFSQQEVAGAVWLTASHGAFKDTAVQPTHGFVYSDSDRYWLLLGYDLPLKQISRNASEMASDSFFFFGAYNIAHQVVLVNYTDQAVVGVRPVDASGFLANRPLLYDDGGSHVYGAADVTRQT
jgi:uncharacterized membrane protein